MIERRRNGTNLCCGNVTEAVELVLAEGSEVVVRAIVVVYRVRGRAAKARMCLYFAKARRCLYLASVLSDRS